MKLYDAAFAPNPRRVRMVLTEKGIDIERIPVAIEKLENRSPEFLARNPYGFVPVLELDDGTLISESLAICRYLDEKFPQPALFGTGAEQRAVIDMWNMRLEYELFRKFMHTFQHSHEYFASRITQVPAYADVCRERALFSLDLLEQELATREFVAGDQLTIADITAWCAIDFARVVKFRLEASRPNLLRWYEALKQRPLATA
jgi:glutathione S-transferase